MEKHFGLRINGKTLAKFRYVCAYNGRSANSQINQLVLNFIADYEKNHEEISIEDLGPYLKNKTN